MARIDDFYGNEMLRGDQTPKHSIRTCFEVSLASARPIDNCRCRLSPSLISRFRLEFLRNSSS